MLEVLLTLVAGLMATAAMTAVMYSVNAYGLASGDMMRAIGSYVTRRYDKSLTTGILIHFAGGLIFALLYLLIWRIMDVQKPIILLYSGALMGLAQGLVVSILLVIMVAEHHPLAKFRKAGFRVALIFVLGHMIYGLVLGAVLGLFAGQALT